MAYKLYDLNGNEVNQHDLQDKGTWCKEGASKEEVFVELFGNKLGLIINPEKETNPYAPDLLNTSNGVLADLKTQNTPFFQAKPRFNLDPQFTVVFNGKDRERYKANYSSIEIYFAVDWQIVRFESYQIIKVDPMVGVWFIKFPELERLLEKAPLHSYQQRQFDQKGNAKGSYILSLLSEGFTQIL